MSAGMLAAFLVFAIATVVLVFYLLSLQRALGRCAPRSRTMAPNLVWLQLIPLFGFYWHFKNVTEISRSLENEYRARGAAVDRPHLALGYGMGICLIAGYALMLGAGAAGQATLGGTALAQDVSRLRLTGSLVALAGIVLTVLYWMRVSRISRHVASLAPSGPAQPRPRPVAQASPGMIPCAQCGALVPTGRFCPLCGAERRAARPGHGTSSGPAAR